jgi:hypothetical protein
MDLYSTICTSMFFLRSEIVNCVAVKSQNKIGYNDPSTFRFAGELSDNAAFFCDYGGAGSGSGPSTDTD